MAWTATELLADARRLGMLPSTITDAEVLAHCNYELQGPMVSLVLRACEEYLTRSIDVTLTAGQAAYPVPRRSVGSRVRNIEYLSGGVLSHLPRLDPSAAASSLTSAQGMPRGFYLDAANIILLPAPSAADTLRVRYYGRPAAVGAVGTAGVAVTEVNAAIPTASRTQFVFGTSSIFPPGVTKVDVVSGFAPFETKCEDATPANITTTSLDVATSSLLATPVVGDYLCLTDAAPVVQLPVELFGVLAQRAAARALQSLGYLEEASAAWAAASSRQQDALSILAPRTDGSPKRLTGGLLAQMRAGRPWGW